MEARIQLCNFLMVILNFRVALEDQCLARCAFLPVRELRAFSVLTSRFRSASSLAWSDDILENERVLLAIVQVDRLGEKLRLATFLNFSLRQSTIQGLVVVLWEDFSSEQQMRADNVCVTTGGSCSEIFMQ